MLQPFSEIACILSLSSLEYAFPIKITLWIKTTFIIPISYLSYLFLAQGQLPRLSLRPRQFSKLNFSIFEVPLIWVIFSLLFSKPIDLIVFYRSHIFGTFCLENSRVIVGFVVLHFACIVRTIRKYKMTLATSHTLLKWTNIHRPIWIVHFSISMGITFLDKTTLTSLTSPW